MGHVPTKPVKHPMVTKSLQPALLKVAQKGTEHGCNRTQPGRMVQKARVAVNKCCYCYAATSWGECKGLMHKFS